jgi:hypothetical protein
MHFMYLFTFPRSFTCLLPTEPSKPSNLGNKCEFKLDRFRITPDLQIRLQV